MRSEKEYLIEVSKGNLKSGNGMERAGSNGIGKKMEVRRQQKYLGLDYAVRKKINHLNNRETQELNCVTTDPV